ncbi:hypothetical protein L1987_53984 [Smallanthus sonchifolius]|uniref:Uncharacterized protein n=1 Tax=Smallanthus sonchifolius TaxID=185202 RepID=A0ACB9E670_9ASTR|nr:hypothetical protein L1987_53984 [Smallanthus sonchifolius]
MLQLYRLPFLLNHNFRRFLHQKLDKMLGVKITIIDPLQQLTLIDPSTTAASPNRVPPSLDRCCSDDRHRRRVCGSNDGCCSLLLLAYCCCCCCSLSAAPLTTSSISLNL